MARAATYTLHLAPGAMPGDAEELDRAVLVRDGFSWGAALVPMLWLFAHRQWLAGLGALVVVVALAVVLALAGFGAGTIVAAEVLLHLLSGFEGASLLGWLQTRRGRSAVDVVQADSFAEAEVKAFTRWLAGEPAGHAPLAGPRAYRREPEPIIGLFPDAEGRA